MRLSEINEHALYWNQSFPMPPSVANKVEEEVSERQLLSDERWLLVKRIATSTTFARAARLSDLLLHLCGHSLLGHSGQLTEQNIALDVFARKGKFDPTADTIVRSHMLRLRQKLEIYFAEEGAQERMRISIPKGGYVPAFEKIEEPVLSPPTAASVVVDTRSNQYQEGLPQLHAARYRRIAAGMILLFLCFLVLAFVLGRRWESSRKAAIADSSARHQLWSRMFPPKSTTILVAADSGLVLLHGITQHNSTLPEYLARDFHTETDTITTMKPETALSISDRRYTSFVDLELFDRLTHLPDALSESYSIRYARDIHVNDLKTSNAILSGSRDANPWIELFEGQMNFVLHDDLQKNVRAFANRKPQPGEQSLYICSQTEYGVMAFLPNLSGTGNVLMIEGTSVAGTEAISDFLFEDSTLEPFLRKILKKDGSLPHFEILVQSNSLNGSASGSQIVAYRTF